MAIPQIIEVPFGLGGAVSGADLGIVALKQAAREEGHDIFDQDLRVWANETSDYSDIPDKYPFLHYGDKVLRTIQRTSDRVYETLDNGSFPMVIAGDHSTAAGTLSGVLRAFPNERLGAVWIDAHADLHSPYTTPSGNAHGMSLAIATGIDNLSCQKQRPKDITIKLWQDLKETVKKGRGLDIKDIVFVGGRAFDPEEKVILSENGNRNFTVNDVGVDGVEKVVAEILEGLQDCDRIYVSFDVDSIDPSFSRGTGTPVEGGFGFEQIFKINELLVRAKKTCCWEMVEINPLLDKDNKMARGCFHILKNVHKIVSEK